MNLPALPRGVPRELSALTFDRYRVNLNADCSRRSTSRALARTVGADVDVAETCSFQPCLRGVADEGVRRHHVSSTSVVQSAPSVVASSA